MFFFCFMRLIHFVLKSEIWKNLEIAATKNYFTPYLFKKCEELEQQGRFSDIPTKCKVAFAGKKLQANPNSYGRDQDLKPMDDTLTEAEKQKLRAQFGDLYDKGLITTTRLPDGIYVSRIKASRILAKQFYSQNRFSTAILESGYDIDRLVTEAKQMYDRQHQRAALRCYAAILEKLKLKTPIEYMQYHEKSLFLDIAIRKLECQLVIAGRHRSALQYKIIANDCNFLIRNQHFAGVPQQGNSILNKKKIYILSTSTLDSLFSQMRFWIHKKRILNS
jgi:hypothetical protein